MNSVLPPIEKRAWYYKQEKAKSVRMAHLRNNVMKHLAFILPFIAILLIAADYLGRSDLFQITEVEYRGVFKNLDHKEVDLITKKSLNGNFFTVDLVEIQQSVANLDWAEEVFISRQWPNKIIIHVEEFKPIMRWSEGGLVMNQGQLIKTDIDSLKDANLLNELPSLDGSPMDLPEMMAKYALWQFVLNSLGINIEELSLSDSAAWTLKLRTADDEMFTLYLGTENPDARFHRFIRLHTQGENYFQYLAYIDARYPNGVVVKRLPQADEDPEKDTKESGDDDA